VKTPPDGGVFRSKRFSDAPFIALRDSIHVHPLADPMSVDQPAQYRGLSNEGRVPFNKIGGFYAAMRPA